ncbi:MAG: cytochrome c peroxidase [Desulfobulbus sp.]|nr:cytochrome c peroxidase [Desulfobulbus sp.]
MNQKEQLGKIMYQDKDFSWNRTQSCQTCHHHISGFADPTNMRDPENTVVSLGDDGTSKGGRNAPSSAYAGFSPPLTKDDQGYLGGMFWDGRATGLSATLADPLAEQAQGPPLNPVEMNMPNKEAVVEVVRDSNYAQLFRQVYGPDALIDTEHAFDDIARAIAVYERSPEVQKFSSKFDKGTLSTQENEGLTVFRDRCASCHSIAPVTEAKGPLFTNYRYYNIGLPANTQDDVPEDDYGLGGFLASKDAPPEFADEAYQENGKFKVPTLRNVAFTAPYGHNGIFATLEEMVQFKNNRQAVWDLVGTPDVDENIYDENGFGAMGLQDGEIEAVVAFLKTLTDK